VLSFLIIAIPMTLFLLDDRIGDALIDSALPSIFSGFFFVGAALYKISLATLLLPIFLLLAVVLYFLFVYRPARAAYSQREENMRLMSDHSMSFKRSTNTHIEERKINRRSFLKGTANYFERVFSIITHSLQHAVTYFSSYHIAVSRRLAFIQKKEWRDMNAPHSFQGLIPANAEMVNINSQLRSARRHCQTVFSPPPEISDMMTSTIQWKRAHEEQMKNKQFANYLDDTGTCVITRKQDAQILLRQLETPIFFSAEEALAAMRVNLIKDSSDSALDVLNRYCTVPIPDFIDQFRETLNLFYPDGIEMTTEEKEESCEMLIAWKDTQDLRITSECVGGALIETEILDFSLFDAWFTSVFVVIMSQLREERLLTHTLRYVPAVKRKVMNSRMRMPEGCPQTEMMHSNLHIDTSKALSLVIPDGLVAPSDSPKEITPVKHCGEDDEVKG
jgi:Ca2+/Na+ antiporter